MPPIRTYIFKHKVLSTLTVTIETYANEDRAWVILSAAVKEINDYVLTK